MKLFPLVFIHQFRAQLEIKEFGRATFEQYWDKVNNASLDILNYPILIFIDSFKVYRNTYQSVIVVY